MSRKVRIEVDPDSDEEIVIKCHSLTQDILDLQKLFESKNSSISTELELFINDSTYIIPKNKILFFETQDRITASHTDKRIYYTDKKLYELEEILSNDFMRVSKSCIINIKAVSSYKKDITGACEVGFLGTDKKVYVSRMYFKSFQEKLKELRHLNEIT